MTNSKKIIQIKISQTPKKIVKEYYLCGLIAIPLKKDNKYPLSTDWQHTALEDGYKSFRGLLNFNVGLLCGKPSGITVLDVDIYDDGVAHQATLDWYNEHKDLLQNTPYVKTTSGNYHFYYLYDESLPNCNLRGKTGLHIEIKNTGSQVVAYPSIVNKKQYTWVKQGELLSFPTKIKDILSVITISKMADDLPKIKNALPISQDDIDVPKCLAGYTITRKYKTNNSTYWDLDKSGLSRKCPIADKIHRKNNTYFRRDDASGFIFHCCWKCGDEKDGNKIVFNDDDSIIQDLKDIIDEEGIIDEKVAEMLERMCMGRVSYSVNTNTWYGLEPDSGRIIKDMGLRLIKTYRHQLMKILKDILFNPKYERFHKTVKKIRNNLGRIHFVEKVMKWFKSLVNDRSIEQQMDMSRNFIGFDNGIFDIRTKAFRLGVIADKISMSVNYKYTPHRNPAIQQEIMEFFDKIYPIPELRDYMLMILGSTLQGKNADNILPICDGFGGNGKSILKELISLTLGEYATELSSSYLGKSDNNGSAPDAYLYDSIKRLIVFFTEPKILDGSTLKKFTGGDAMKVRTLYQKEPITIIPKFTMILMLNKSADLKINDTSDGCARRCRVIPHLSTFKDTPNPKNKFEFLKDTSITKNFDRWKMELFHILIDNLNKYKKHGKIMSDCPAEVLEASKRFMNEDNPYKDYISQHIIKGDESDKYHKASLKEIWKHFSQWWVIHKDEYSTNKPTKSPLRNTIESTTKKLFKKRDRLYKEGIAKAINATTVLVGYTLKAIEYEREECNIESDGEY